MKIMLTYGSLLMKETECTSGAHWLSKVSASPFKVVLGITHSKVCCWLKLVVMKWCRWYCWRHQ
jgi:hypothetical protein